MHRQRAGLALVLAITLLPTIWLRSSPAPYNREQVLVARPLSADFKPPGPFTVAGVWHLTSPHGAFGSYSALVPMGEKRLLAIGDRATMLVFSPPGSTQQARRLGTFLKRSSGTAEERDYEAVAIDPHSGRVWVAVEGANRILRVDLESGEQARRTIPEMADWRGNTGPEAMVRLGDGRFIALCECRTGWLDRDGHPGLLFDRDPTLPAARATRFTFKGSPGFRPTDMALLPDGRALVLMRRITWPMPPRFKASLVLVDPAQIANQGVLHGIELAELEAPLPVDNFEGLAVVPGNAGRLVAWLISDDNRAVTQSTLLLKLEFALRDLPAKQKAPGLPGRP
jgi:hypothetical protein